PRPGGSVDGDDHVAASLDGVVPAQPDHLHLASRPNRAPPPPAPGHPGGSGPRLPTIPAAPAPGRSRPDHSIPTWRRPPNLGLPPRPASYRSGGYLLTDAPFPPP